MYNSLVEMNHLAYEAVNINKHNLNLRALPPAR